MKNAKSFMDSPIFSDADEIILAIRAELEAAVRTDEPDKQRYHVYKAHRCIRELQRRVDERTKVEFECPRCGEMRNSEFCQRCMRLYNDGDSLFDWMMDEHEEEECSREELAKHRKIVKEFEDAEVTPFVRK